MPLSRAFRASQKPAERMLTLRIFTVVGLVLLLVAGAWSTSHGTSDGHATVCIATGIAPVGGDAPEGPSTPMRTALTLQQLSVSRT